MKLSIHSKNYAKRFSNVFTNLISLNDSAVLYFSKDGLYIQGMDSSHVSLYEVKFDKEWFSSYNYSDDDACQISINLEYFKKILSTRADDQIIYLEYNGLNPDILTIIFRSIVKSSKEFPREYEMSLMDIDTERLDLPNDEQSVQFYMDSKIFSSLVKQLNMFDETVVINCTEEEINFKSKGSGSSMSVNLFDNDKEYVDEFMIDENYKLKISFALRYFDHFCAFSKVSSRVRLSFTNDFPVEVFYSLDSNKKKESDNNEDDNTEENTNDTETTDEPKSFIRFFLAPRIVDAEEDEDAEEEEEDED